MKLSQALVGFALGAGLILASVAASAQDDRAAGAKTYGEWQVTCSSQPAAIPCVMEEFLSRKGANAAQAQPILAIAIGYDQAHKHNIAKIGVPLGITLGKGVVLSTDSYTSPALRILQCTRVFCFVQTGLPDEVITALSSASTGKISFALEGDGKIYHIEFPLKGFAEAHQAIMQGGGGKVAKAAPAPAPAQ